MLAKPRKLQSQAANTISNTNADTIPKDELLSVSTKELRKMSDLMYVLMSWESPDGNRFVGPCLSPDCTTTS